MISASEVDNKFHCELCDDSFDDKNGIERHYRVQHAIGLHSSIMRGAKMDALSTQFEEVVRLPHVDVLEQQTLASHPHSPDKQPAFPLSGPSNTGSDNDAAIIGELRLSCGMKY